jgi:U3 small nucleolar RNA-associated protein MPP10
MANDTPNVLLPLISNPEHFLKPTAKLYSDSLASAKRYLDPLAFDISQEQHTRKKRKGASSASDKPARPLALREVHINGFTPQQIWEQALRILQSCDDATGRDLAVVRNSAVGHEQPVSDSRARSSSDEEDDEQGITDEEADGVELDSVGDLGSQMDADSSIREEEYEDEDEEEEEDEDKGEEAEDAPARTALQPDKFGLNDGFFSIDEFNKQTAFFEHKDNRPTIDNEEDEEQIDLDADPFGAGMDSEGSDEDDEQDMDEEENDDIVGMDPDEEEEEEEEEEDGDDRNLRYEDFFDPPALKEQTKRKTSDRSKTESREKETNIDEEVDRAMADVHRDLFDSEPDDEGDDDDSAMESDADAVNLHGLSTHEQRRAKLADEIRKLEAANVSRKEWTMVGEARGTDRPQNALLEEELEFEHVGKPVPVITAETTNDIEALIKQRIVAKEFDDIPRRHALAIEQQGSRKNAKFELDSSKPQQSLAEMYEADHLRATDPGYVDVKDAKLQKEHLEIRQLWNDIRSQLDTLSNWHYRPKAPGVNINVVQDVDTIMMEDARPSGAAGAGASGGMLAPQEIYAPGDDGRNRGEVVLPGGVAVAKDEMTREAKLRRRKREKQKLKKSGRLVSKPEGAAAKQQKVVTDLKKGDVKVIGKEGHLTDIHGQAADLSGKKDRRATLKL